MDLQTVLMHIYDGDEVIVISEGEATLIPLAACCTYNYTSYTIYYPIVPPKPPE